MLNRRTVFDAYPVPQFINYLPRLAGCRVFTVVDISNAFHHIPIAPEDKEKTAIATPFGGFHFNFMPFGLTNAGASWQRLMDKILRGVGHCFCYVDDVLIASENHEDHERHVAAVMKKIQGAGLTVRPDKCQNAKERVTFLGFDVSADGVTPAADKAGNLRDFPLPCTLGDVSRFLGQPPTIGGVSPTWPTWRPRSMS